ncbi:MAG TPA: type II secretion system F family protein [Chloroflexota bacterium]|jgi:tight adherence protein C
MSVELVAAAAVGVGVYLVVSTLPFGAGLPSLEDRLRRFDVDLRVAERRIAMSHSRPLLPWAPVNAVLQPLLEDIASPVRRILGGERVYGADLEWRLRLVRPGTDPRGFVAQQLLLGGAAGIIVLMLALASGAAATVALTLSTAAAASAFVMPEVLLRAECSRRRERIVAELPAVCRLLSMALDAGMSLDRSLLVVARRSAGPLGRGVLAACEEVVGDRRLKDALSDLARRERLQELDAFITLLNVSEHEGLELIPSLEAMATSLKEKHAARTIEAAEKGSIKMLAPVAFVMFPVALAVALAPLLGSVLSLVGHS